MKMNIYRWKDLPTPMRERIFRRSGEDISRVEETVKEIIRGVKDRGDQALREYTLKFDGVDLSGLPLEVTTEEYEKAPAQVSPEVRQALDYCIANTRTIHQRQVSPAMSFTEIRPGVFAGERPLPVDSAGIYIPRGRGSFPSMLYMCAIPAKIAGVPEIALVTPPNPDGSVDPACLYAAARCGLKRVFRVGGAQAVAALAYGTESLPKTLKIVGPGSRYVAAAKKLLGGVIDSGLPAGPSEAIVLADETADPRRLALDLMVEAEHGSDSAALLLTPCAGLAEQTARAAEELAETLPEPRKTFIRHVFSAPEASDYGYGGIIITETLEEAGEIINDYAPEHLQIHSERAFELLPLIRNAGEILLGSSLPFSAANYAAGVNAVLPTGGAAKTYSALSVRDFIKYNSVVYLTPPGLAELAGPVKALADYEGFITHGDAIKKRGL
ncbi:MAG: histidinol dehydrogenase [Spirochaetales bacterium]|jgi:histidinol dehydrogenase|nr:histidinol dehydrogenase [Spirochaetales bacterium]